jgi:hypothetical protein
MSHAANLGRIEIVQTLAVDFREREIFDWLLAHGTDVNAGGAVDGDGFGGHTPLFNAVVCGPWPDAAMARTLLERGADRSARANLRKVSSTRASGARRSPWAVRPVTLTTGRLTNKAKICSRYGLTDSISRADVASFLLRCLEEPTSSTSRTLMISTK